MRPSLRPLRPSLRPLAVTTLAIAALALPSGAALADHQVSHTGSPGTWTLKDSASNPAADCSYDGGGTAGGTYLTGIRLRNPVKIKGTSASVRSVGYRPIIQHKIGHAWVTVRKGALISGGATSAHAATLPGGLTTFGPKDQPKRPFRLALRLIWYRADASVQGTRTILVDYHAKRDGGVANRCAGFVSDVVPS